MSVIRNFSILCCLLALLGGCTAGRTAFNKAEQLEQEGKLDEAVLRYADAATANPDIYEYRLRFLTASTKAARKHMEKGDEYFDDERLDAALKEYQAAVALDASLERARQQSEKVVKLQNSQVYYQEGLAFEKEGKVREAMQSYQKSLSLDPENSDAQGALERVKKSKKLKLAGFELNLKSTKPITLKFTNAKIKEVFNIVSKLSGINFIFDETVKDVNVTVFMENATFQQALEILTNMNKLGRKVLNESTIIVYPKTPDKIKQYEELMVETFYLNKLEAKKAVNLIRSMLQVKKIYVNEEMNALVIRDTPDTLDVARRILDANDAPDAELVLEVEVIEISKSNEEKFGLLLSQYNVATAGWTPGFQQFSDTLNPTTTSSTVSSSTGSSITSTTPTTPTTGLPQNLLQTFGYKGFTGFMTVPNATYNFGKTVADGETLANPRLRVKNREKAKFNVGTRVPITTTSSPVGGGVNVNVQYVDVGVKVNAEPTIQLNNEVTIKLSVEVSSIISTETVGGATSATQVVTIGTRNLDTVLNLRDGETSVIGGLIQDNKTKNKQKVFLLGDLPVLGPFLTNNNNQNQKNELVLAITPRVVRGITIPEPDSALFWSGKEDEPTATKIFGSFAEENEEAEAPPAASAPAQPAAAPATTPVPGKRGRLPRTGPVSVQPQAVPAAVTPAVMPPAAAPPVSAPPAAAPPAVAPPAVVPSVAPPAGTVPPAPGGPVPERGGRMAPAPAVPSAEGAAQSVNAGQAAAGPSTLAVPAVGVPVITPTPTATPSSGQVPPPEGTPGAAASQPPKQAGPPPRGIVTLNAPLAAKLNDIFTIEVKVSDAENLARTSLSLQYDANLIDFVSADEGGFMRQGGVATEFKAPVERESSRVSMIVKRSEGAPGAKGNGTLATLRFKALKRGLARFDVQFGYLYPPSGSSMQINPPGALVEVK